MKLIVGSDYHGSAVLQEEALQQLITADSYINCGDFCTWAGAQPGARDHGYDSRGAQEVQSLHQFLTRIEQMGKPWLFLPGNHDPAAAVLQEMNQDFEHGQAITASGLMWLCGVRLLVVPWTPPCGWSWPLTRDHVRELLADYGTSTTDILLTHAPPKGILDEDGKWYHRKTPTLRPLADALRPRFFLCGHMHLDGGKTVVDNGTTFVNAALHNMALEV